MKKLLEIINVVLDNAEMPMLNELNSEMNLQKDCGLDSLCLAELTVRIEMEYGIDIFQDGIVVSVGDVWGKIKLVV